MLSLRVEFIFQLDMEFELKTPPIKSSLSIQSDDLNTLFDAYLLEEPE